MIVSVLSAKYFYLSKKNHLQRKIMKIKSSENTSLDCQLEKKSSSGKIQNIFFRSSLLFFLVFLSLSITGLDCKQEKEIKDTGIDTTQPMDTTKTEFPDTTTKPEPIVLKDPLYLFIGTYSENGSKGIYIYKMDTVTGILSFINSTQTQNPSYLCLHPNKKWLYAVGEQDNGTVSSFSFDSAQKKLTIINTVSSKGKAPCFVSIDKTGKYVMAANYSSGNITLFPINSDGSLKAASSVIQHTGKSIDASRQAGPNAHMIAQEAQNKIVYASDLGIDKLMAYNIDTINQKFISTGLNTSITPGSGPRHFVGHKKLQVMYVLSEMKGTIGAFNVNQENGKLTLFQTIMNMKDGDKRYPGSADIHISPNGKYLYASNRGDVNTIGMYTIDQNNGTLTLIGFVSTKGSSPRNFVISPSGKYLLIANQNTGNVVVFEIDANGSLIDKNIEIKVPRAVCLKFL